MHKNLLDHGYCHFVDSMGSDLSIVRAARVSHNADWRTGKEEKSDHRLINYLWSHWHTTPFESVTVTFEVQAPIFVFRQWHRHRTQSISEVSARYTELPELFYVPQPSAIGVQSKDNKQGRDIVGPNTDLGRDGELAEYVLHCEQAFVLYRSLIAAQWPRELARAVLPLANYSRMFATANLLNWFKFVSLRSDPHAQYEIRVYSNAILEMLRTIAPVAVEAFERWEVKLIDRLAK